MGSCLDIGGVVARKTGFLKSFVRVGDSVITVAMRKVSTNIN